jgi:hypothetical protein
MRTGVGMLWRFAIPPHTIPAKKYEPAAIIAAMITLPRMAIKTMAAIATAGRP